MSRVPGPTRHDPSSRIVPPRTPGPLGENDAADPDAAPTKPGDTPGSLGLNDGAMILASAGGSVPLQPLGDGLGVPPSDNNTKKPRNVQKLSDHTEFCFSKGESTVFDALLQTAVQLGVGVVPYLNSDASTLATYDLVHNVIWIPAPDFQQTRHDDEFKRTIAHELVHAKQNQPLLEQASESESRKELVAKRAQAMSEEDYVKFLWNREIEAERTAWNIYNETINTFSKRQDEKGFSASDLKELTDIRVGEFTTQKKAAYEEDFRKAYRKLTARRLR